MDIKNITEGWVNWNEKKHGNIPVGTHVKVINVGNNGKVGKVTDEAPTDNYSIVKINGKEAYYHNSDLMIKENKLNKENKMSNKIKLSNLMKEWNIDEQPELTNEDKTLFLEKVKNFNSYGESIYAKGNLREIAEDMSKIALVAEHLTLSEADEWFDKVTINRNMKQLKEISKNFQKEAHAAQAVQERLSTLYEEMGTILNRYFTIEDKQLDEKLKK